MRIKQHSLGVGMNVLHMHEGAQTLDVQAQNGGANITLWSLEDESEPLAVCGMVVFGTGQAIPSDNQDDMAERYVGTVQCGHNVWHIFAAPVEWFAHGGQLH